MKRNNSTYGFKRVLTCFLAAFLFLSAVSFPAVTVKATMLYSAVITLTNLKAGVPISSIGISSSDGSAVITSITAGTSGIEKLSCTSDMTISFRLTGDGMFDPMFSLTIQPEGYSDITLNSGEYTDYGSYIEGSFPLSALPHNYSSSVTRAATCTTDGVRTYTCAGCGDSYTETINKLGHNYTSAVTKKATCGEDGVKTFTCANCKDTYTEVISATGKHTYPSSWTVEKEATTTATGLQYKLCTVCSHRIEETIPKLSAESPAETTKISETTTTAASTTVKETESSGESEEDDASSEEEKETESTEERTKASAAESLEPVRESDTETSEETDATESIAAEESYAESNEEETESISFIDRIRFGLATAKRAIGSHKTGAILIGTGTAALIAGAGVLLKTKAAASAAAKAAKAAKAAEAGKLAAGLPDLSGKTVVTYLTENEFNAAFIKLIKEKPFLTLVAVDKPTEDLTSQVHDEDPDLVVLEVSDEESMKQTSQDIVSIKAVCKDTEFALITTTEYLTLPGNEEKLKAMEAAGTIRKYTTAKVLVTPGAAFSHLILPIYKPELTVEDAASYIGDVADLLGIPGISFITRLYTDGKDIKEITELHEKGIVEKSAIIADIADILGLSQVASVLGLIDDLDTMRSALEKSAGTQDGIDGISAAKDLAEVVSDLIS